VRNARQRGAGQRERTGDGEAGRVGPPVRQRMECAAGGGTGSRPLWGLGCILVLLGVVAVRHDSWA
jgi:hypothetical protein